VRHTRQDSRVVGVGPKSNRSVSRRLLTNFV